MREEKQEVKEVGCGKGKELGKQVLKGFKCERVSMRGNKGNRVVVFERCRARRGAWCFILWG